ncbi:MAG: hypothetical protein ACXU9L_05770 [Thermodesulfobacteriota bacterium]
MVKRIDDMEEANLKLYSVLKDPKVDQEIRERRATGRKMADVAKNNRQFFLETAVVRHVENYLNYLSSLLLEIFTQRPETLRSSERVEISSVLNFQSIPDLVRAFAERKVENLSYSSIADLCDFFRDRFKVELFSTGEMPAAVEAVETRNISVHNRCIINNRYVQKTRIDPAQAGKIKELFTKDLDRFVTVFLRSVKEVDKKVRSKLKISGHRLKM